MNHEEKFTIYYFAGTHWDREWYQPFQGFRYRLVSVVNELIEVLEKNPEFRVFHLDGQTIVLEDYLEIEPGKKERLGKLIKDGRIAVGPWYVMPDEFLLSGESLIRNLMTGHRIAESFGTKAWKYGYVCDIFGHIAQMPQIFNGFGIRYALLGRGTNEHTTPAHFRWAAPDGSECLTFKLEDRMGYGSFTADVTGSPGAGGRAGGAGMDKEALASLICAHIERERSRSGAPVVLLMDALDHENIHVQALQYLKTIKELYPQAEIRIVNLEEMGKELEQYRDALPVKAGELSETAKQKANYLHLITHTLSSRYPVKKANDECQTLLEKWVEPLTAIGELEGFHTQRSYVSLAYRFLMQNHPHDSICGCSVDQIYRDMAYRFDQCSLISSQLVGDLLNRWRDGRRTDPGSQTRALLLWNPLPYRRREVVTVEIDFSTDYPEKYQEPFGYEEKNSFRILNGRGEEIPYGLAGIRKNWSFRRYNQFVEQADVYTVSFEAEMPAMGMSEYKIVPFAQPSRYLQCLAKDENEAENEYIRLKVNGNGTIDVYDKLRNTSYNQLLSYVDDGEIGDGWYHANPAEDRVLTSAGCACAVERVENGPDRAVFRIVQDFRVPEAMDYGPHGIRRSQRDTTLKIVSKIGLSKGARGVDVETTVDNTACDHRLRLKIPTGIRSRSFFASQAFTVVERPVGVNAGTQNWKECDVPEKQTGGIVFKRDSDGGGLAFISAFGIHECAAADDEKGSLMPTLFRSFGKTVMTSGEAGGQLLQELSFKYAVVPMQPGTSAAELTRMQERMQAGVRSTVFRAPADYALPDARSFFELTGEELCMSMLKRPENLQEGSVVVRVFNLSGRRAEGALKCYRPVERAEALNLNEEAVAAESAAPGGSGRHTVPLDLGPWKINTLRLYFQK